MKSLNLKLCTIIASFLCFGCSGSGDDPLPEQPGSIAFLQETLPVSFSAGEVTARITWTDTTWEVVMDTDNGIISNISPTTGGGEGKVKEYGQVKLRYKENTTEKSRSQEVFLVNKKNGERSKLTLVQATRHTTVPVALNMSVKYQSVVGFGGMYNPKVWTGSNLITDAEMNKMYAPDQLGYNILRLMIYEKEANWADDVNGALLAQQKGAIIFASPWHCPEGTTEEITINGKVHPHLKPASYPDFANHLVKYVNYMKGKGVNIYAISVQNEPDMDFTFWRPQEVVDFIKGYGAQIRETGVKLMAPEACGMQPEYTDPVLNDSEAFSKVDIVAGHLYQGFTKIEESGYVKNRHTYITNLYNSRLASAGKTWWMTEHLFNDGEKETDPALWEFRKWSYNMEHLAKEIHMCMEGYCSAYIYWYLKRFYGMLADSDARSAAASGEVLKNGYILSHYAKYASNMDRIKINMGDSELKATAYTNKEGTEATIVFLNMKNESYNVQVSVPASINSASAVETTETKNMQSLSVNVLEGKKAASLFLSPNSIVSVRFSLIK